MPASSRNAGLGRNANYRDERTTSAGKDEVVQHLEEGRRSIAEFRLTKPIIRHDATFQVTLARVTGVSCLVVAGSLLGTGRRTRIALVIWRGSRCLSAWVTKGLAVPSSSKAGQDRP
jgi:hypothetical protein